MVKTDNGGFDFFSGMPWYVKAVAVVAVPSLISLGVVWNNETRMVAKVEETRIRVERLEVQTSEHDKAVKEDFLRLTESGKTNERLLRLICSGVAPKEAKSACWEK